MIGVSEVTGTASVALAAIHAEAFDHPWSTEEIAALMTGPGVFALAADNDGEPAGFVLCRVVADEAEILTIASRPAHRRRRVASSLLGAAMAVAGDAGADRLFLEVAVDNTSALALYRSQGFAEVGRRPGYFVRPEGAVAALIMRLDLNRRTDGAYA